MSDFKVKYTSEVHLDRDWAFAPGHWFKLDWPRLETEFQEPACYLVALDEKQLNFIHQLVSVFPKYYRNWGYTKSTLDEGAWDAIQAWVSELELCLMSGCKVGDLLASVDRLTAAIAGETSPETDDQGNPLYDYSSNGVVPTLNQLFTTNEELFYDSRNMAEILSIGLIGRKLDLLPLPWQGTGLADIADEQMQTLHERFVMADNVIGEKNMAETMESLLRKTGLLDPEAQPNVSDILDNVLRLGGNESWWGMVKRLFRDALIKLGLEDELTDLDNTTITQAILLLSAAESQGGVLRAIERAIRESQTEININNTANCNGGKPSLNGSNNGQIVLTDEGVNVEIEQPETPPLLGDGN